MRDRIRTKDIRGAIFRRRTALLVIALLCLSAPLAASAQEITGTFRGRGIGQRVNFTRNERPRRAWAGTLRFEFDGGQEVAVYCIQLDVAVSSGHRYVGSGPVEDLPNGCPIRYILDQFPASEVNDEAEGAARQMAVWHFSDGVDLETIDDEQAEVRDRAMEIAGEAETGGCPRRRTDPPNLRIEPSSTTLPPGERLVYEIAADPLDAGQIMTATVSGPAVFDDGLKSVTVALDTAGAATLAVTGTGEGESTLKVVLPYRLEAGVVLSEIDPSRPSQRLVMAERLDIVAEAEAHAVWHEEATSTPTKIADTSTPAATETVPATATVAATQTPVTTPTAGASATATTTAVTTETEEAPRSEKTPTVHATPQMPEKLPKTGSGGGRSSAPVAAVGLLLLLAALLTRRWLASARRA